MTANTEYKVKLVAIAKDEAAYLPEWIFHHLHFGFDAIDIYVNNTIDNTSQLDEALSELDSVRFLNGDVFFDGSYGRPQAAAYIDAYEKALSDGYSHILFLDIDEFWTPRDFNSNIKVCIKTIDADVISFEWLVHMDEYSPFSETFKSNIVCKKGRFVKSMSKTDLNLRFLHCHNVNVKDAIYKLADASLFKFKIGENSAVNPSELTKPIKPYFILHRMFRSQVEYVSMLGKGIVKNSHEKVPKFKNNRNGYYVASDSDSVFSIDEIDLLNYQNLKFEFFVKYNINSIVNEARKFVIKRFESILNLFKTCKPEDVEIVNKISRNIRLRDFTNR
jgi:hypothetical protein